ncbi:MinD/ParA family protein [Pontibacillus yanchengensis]|uniref:Cobyrinic acid ac-diamide synthase n=1 Tax=Pontibacillus yanchengensis Y32 TaxID=1385514 RepID=A0A0A2TIU5_9BACI|nr:MinD/ParA family protein [Pontibacillus yanchengensis]KGP74006.1 cobyrinic acid ac-diamide synthase [Pontibacillus yanchengensis Y32]
MNDQAYNLRQKLNSIKNHSEAKTIAIASGKGGVGKSNFALNFALSLTKQNKKVLIFDLDIGMGNIDILLGLSPQYSIVDMFEEHLSIYDVIETGPNSLSYIAAGSGLSKLFHLNESKSEYFFSQLQEIIEWYDYIFFDMGAGVTDESLNFILAANECIVVTTPEPTSLTDAYAMIKHISNKQTTLPIYLLVNRAHSQKAGEQTMERLQDVVKQFLNKSIQPLGILPDDRTVTKAVSRQIPFVTYDEHSKVSRMIHNIVDQYVQNTISIEKQTKFPFVSKLKRFMLER